MCAKASLTIQDALEKEKSQYPHAPLRSISKLMLFSSSLHALFLLLISPLFYFFPSQLQYKKREPANLSLPLALSLSLSLSQSFTLGRRWRGGGLSFFLLLIVSWYNGRWYMIHNCASHPSFLFLFFRTDRTVPGLSAAVPPYRSAALCGTWGSSARCAPDQVSCAAAESEAQKHRTHCLCAHRNPRIEN